MIEIRKRRMMEGTGYRVRERNLCWAPHYIVIYVVVQDGLRIDSFLKKRNAQALVKKIKTSSTASRLSLAI